MELEVLKFIGTNLLIPLLKKYGRKVWKKVAPEHLGHLFKPKLDKIAESIDILKDTKYELSLLHLNQSLILISIPIPESNDAANFETLLNLETCFNSLEVNKFAFSQAEQAFNAALEASTQVLTVSQLLNLLLVQMMSIFIMHHDNKQYVHIRCKSAIETLTGNKIIQNLIRYSIDKTRFDKVKSIIKEIEVNGKKEIKFDLLKKIIISKENCIDMYRVVKFARKISNLFGNFSPDIEIRESFLLKQTFSGEENDLNYNSIETLEQLFEFQKFNDQLSIESNKYCSLCISNENHIILLVQSNGEHNLKLINTKCRQLVVIEGCYSDVHFGINNCLWFCKNNNQLKTSEILNHISMKMKEPVDFTLFDDLVINFKVAFTKSCIGFIVGNEVANDHHQQQQIFLQIFDIKNCSNKVPIKIPNHYHAGNNEIMKLVVFDNNWQEDKLDDQGEIVETTTFFLHFAVILPFEIIVGTITCRKNQGKLEIRAVDPNHISLTLANSNINQIQCCSDEYGNLILAIGGKGVFIFSRPWHKIDHSYYIEDNLVDHCLSLACNQGQIYLLTSTAGIRIYDYLPKHKYSNHCCLKHTVDQNASNDVVRKCVQNARKKSN